MKLSVIIVNYNVKYFLEQTLNSIDAAAKSFYSVNQNFSFEIIVVDNNSVDGSSELIRKKFPHIHLIENKINSGFAKANNQALRISRGEYVLLLNPDTVLEENTFEKTIQFMDEHSEAGALGVKMVDGKGNFLPESKRGFPTPEVAFYKLFGLSKFFPQSKLFGKYHLGYLNENQIHEVDVLAGAFMLIRKKVLDEIGLLDEAFFMYGEDIDLSYRIKKAGYKNYYFPETRIIHYKGESTKKGSLNYVRMFYSAMDIFAKKHFSSQRAALFTILIQTAIFFKAGLSVLIRFFRNFFVPFTDAVVLYGGMIIIKNLWETNVRKEVILYPETYLFVNIPCYIFIWMVSVYYSGGYDKPFRVYKMLRGIFAGTVIIAAFYGFVPESYRFSRGMILLGAVWAVLAMIFLRWVRHLLFHKNFGIEESVIKKVVIVGDEEEGKRALDLLHRTRADVNFIGFVSPRESELLSENYLGSNSQLSEIAEVYRIDEIIFCSKDVPSAQIMDSMTVLQKNIDYKILPAESLSIIGSNSKDTSGDLYTIEIILAITTAGNTRNKRLIDVTASLIFFLWSPFLIFIIKSPLSFFKNIFLVLFGKKTWVGYYHHQSEIKLPEIKKGILSPLDSLSHFIGDEKTIDRLNMLYAKDYTPLRDIEIIFKGIRKLGQN